MISVKGIYKDGIVELEEPLELKSTSKVIVTFLEDETFASNKRLTAKDFSFARAREASKKYKGNLSDAVIEERTRER